MSRLEKESEARYLAADSCTNVQRVYLPNFR